MSEVSPLSEPVLFRFSLPHLAASFEAGASVKIVAIGSSSTQGEGNVLPYPERLEDALSRKFPDVEFVVINKGTGGTEAPEQLTRLDKDVLAEKPAMVIWQIGTDAAYHNDYDLKDLAESVALGLKRLSGQGMDVVLMDPQYVPALIGPDRNAKTETIVKLIADAAERSSVNVFSRFKLMQSWVLKQQVPLEQLVDSEDPDRLHVSDWATGAVSDALSSTMIVDLEQGDGGVVIRRRSGEPLQEGSFSAQKPFDDGEKPRKNIPETYFDQPGSRQPPWVDESDARRVTLFFATTRQSIDGDELFSGEREAKATSYGIACLKVPEDRTVGSDSIPLRLTVFRLTLFQGSNDPRHHFSLEDHRILSKEEWKSTIEKCSAKDALIFVHGYNVTFLEGLYKCAQVAWDIRYPGLPILFSWASRGSLTSYWYDRGSAELAQRHFLQLIVDLQSAGVTTLNIIAHSMGNMVVLGALRSLAATNSQLRLGNLLMAAPDVDADIYRDWAPSILPIVKGMTLYASSKDRAMKASKFLAGGIPRAGDVPTGGPVLVDRVETIDASSIGGSILGLNHGTFSSEKSILSDISLLFKGLPSPRLPEIGGMPRGVKLPQWWSYGR
jgi:esterase/lipase superfamily enzyme/lysophospholipase L1-like esterase